MQTFEETVSFNYIMESVFPGVEGQYVLSRLKKRIIINGKEYTPTEFAEKLRETIGWVAVDTFKQVLEKILQEKP